MIRHLLFIISLVMLPTAFATTYMNGVIRKGTQFEAMSIPAMYYVDKVPFPRRDYELSGIFIDSLNYDEKSQSNVKNFDLTVYRGILAHGNLTLLSYNKKNGEYMFKLILKPVLIAHGLDLNILSKPINGQIKFIDNSSYFFKGKFDAIHKILYPSSQSQITLKINNSEEFRENMLLTAEENIPVRIEVT